MSIVSAVVLCTLVGAVGAIILVAASKFMAVEEDPRIEEVAGCLAGANCGGCGYAGCGFMLAMVMFSGVRKRVEACDPPAPFKGLPITLIAAAITSLSFMGFGGLVENLFNVTL